MRKMERVCGWHTTTARVGIDRGCTDRRRRDAQERVQLLHDLTELNLDLLALG